MSSMWFSEAWRGVLLAWSSMFTAANLTTDYLVYETASPEGSSKQRRSRLLEPSFHSASYDFKIIPISTIDFSLIDPSVDDNRKHKHNSRITILEVSTDDHMTSYTTTRLTRLPLFSFPSRVSTPAAKPATTDTLTPARSQRS